MDEETVHLTWKPGDRFRRTRTNKNLSGPIFQDGYTGHVREVEIEGDIVLGIVDQQSHFHFIDFVEKI